MTADRPHIVTAPYRPLGSGMYVCTCSCGENATGPTYETAAAGLVECRTAQAERDQRRAAGLPLHAPEETPR